MVELGCGRVMNGCVELDLVVCGCGRMVCGESVCRADKRA